MSVKELKLELKERGLKTSGLKASSSNYLLQHIQEIADDIYVNEVDTDENGDLPPEMS